MFNELEFSKFSQSVPSFTFKVACSPTLKSKVCLHAGIIWKDVLLLEDVLHEAALPDYSLEVFLKCHFNYFFY